MPRIGFKSHVGHLMKVVFDLAYTALDDLIAADKSHVAQPIIDPGGGVFAVLLNPGPYVFAKRIKLTLTSAG